VFILPRGGNYSNFSCSSTTTQSRARFATNPTSSLFTSSEKRELPSNIVFATSKKARRDSLSAKTASSNSTSAQEAERPCLPCQSQKPQFSLPSSRTAFGCFRRRSNQRRMPAMMGIVLPPRFRRRVLFLFGARLRLPEGAFGGVPV
jgi:hypothetical protein